MEYGVLSDDARERTLAAVDAGNPVVDVAPFFQNGPSTIRRWVRWHICPWRVVVICCEKRPKTNISQ